MELSQLNAYRQVALDHLEVILRKLPPEPQTADYFVDYYVRSLSQLPERPENANPYVGLYGAGSTMDEYRDVAVDRLQELVMALPELAEVDGEVDRYIRIISELPERPACLFSVLLTLTPLISMGMGFPMHQNILLQNR